MEYLPRPETPTPGGKPKLMKYELTQHYFGHTNNVMESRVIIVIQKPIHMVRQPKAHAVSAYIDFRDMGQRYRYHINFGACVEVDKVNETNLARKWSSTQSCYFFNVLKSAITIVLVI